MRPSLSAEAKRAKTAAAIEATGHCKSKPASTVHFPVPFCDATSRMESTIQLPFPSLDLKIFAVISIRYPPNPPDSQSSKNCAICSLVKELQFFKIKDASDISCISAYSIPLWTIFTKCPAPPSPIHLQHTVPSEFFAAADCNIFLTFVQAFGLPPTIIDAPWRAPSSPPDMPVPTNNIPSLSSASTRRAVSR